MSSPAKGIYDILKAKGVENLGLQMFIGKLPAEPAACIAIKDSGGKTAFSNLLIDYPTVQLLARGSEGSGGYEAAYEALEVCRNHLLGIPSSPTEFPELTSCTQIGHITPIGYTEQNRPVFSLNLQLIVEPTARTGGHRE